MSPKASHAVRAIVSLALAAVLLALFLRRLDFAAVGRAIREVHAGWLATAVLISLLVIPIRSWRWTRLLRRVGRVRQWDAISATCIGFAATTLLPARAGEVVRPVALSRTSRLPVSPLLASVGLERLIDLVMVLLLFVVYALGGWAPAGMGPDETTRFALLRRSAIVLGAGTVAGLLVFAFLAAKPSWAERALAPFLKLVPERFRAKVSAIVHSFLAGLGTLRTPGEILVVAAASAFLWLVICLQIQATLLAFGLRMPFPVSFFVLTWAVIGLAVPTPGGVGGYHAAVAYSLTGFYGVATNTAGALALVSHVVSFAPVTLLGLLFLASGGLSFGSLAKETAPEEPETRR